jgi:hypothetical protein
MRLWFALAVLGGLTAVHAADRPRAQFFTFAQWELLPPAAQDAYIAGILDGKLVSTYLDPYDEAIYDRYSNCLLRSRMTSTQLRMILLNRVAKSPAMRSGAVSLFLDVLLVETCPDLLGPDVTDRLFREMNPVPGDPSLLNGPRR